MTDLDTKNSEPVFTTPKIGTAVLTVSSGLATSMALYAWQQNYFDTMINNPAEASNTISINPREYTTLYQELDFQKPEVAESDPMHMFETGLVPMALCAVAGIAAASTVAAWCENIKMRAQLRALTERNQPNGPK